MGIFYSSHTFSVSQVIVRMPLGQIRISVNDYDRIHSYEIFLNGGWVVLILGGIHVYLEKKM